jgi:hypothetical protein
MLSRYKENLRIEGNKVYSYSTHVATIDGRNLIVHGWWSVTTSKHINYVAAEYGLTKIDGDKIEDKDETSFMRTVGNVAALASIFCNSPAESNDWKARMLKAGLPGLSMPDDWDTLSEDEKTRRLDQVVSVAQAA